MPANILRDILTSRIRTIPSVSEFHRIVRLWRSRTLTAGGELALPHSAPKYKYKFNFNFFKCYSPKVRHRQLFHCFDARFRFVFVDFPRRFVRLALHRLMRVLPILPWVFGLRENMF